MANTPNIQRDPLEERDILKILDGLDDDRVRAKIASFLFNEEYHDVCDPHHDREGSWRKEGRISFTIKSEEK